MNSVIDSTFTLLSVFYKNSIFLSLCNQFLPMKYFKIFLFLFFLAIVFVVFKQYPRLNIISGYAAKNMCSCLFEADRDRDFVIATDNNFSPINLATYDIDTIDKKVTASVKGMMKRTAVYQDDLGCQLLLKNEEITMLSHVPVPHNCPIEVPFPYGNEEPKDSIFSTINYTKLQSAVAHIFDDEGKDSLQTRSLLVVYKNYIIAEKYDEGFDKNSKILGWSMTKSVMATLFGILEKQGEIDLQATNLFPEWENDARKNISLNHLLHMNSGLEWEENYDKISDVTKMLFLEKDMSQMQLHKPLEFEINTHWNYSSGASNLLSAYLRQQFPTQEAYLDFPIKQLFDKLGMSSMMMETDLSGNYVASSYGWATTRDWAKLGLLYLHRGNWNGEQLFNESWIDFVNSPSKNSNAMYGAHFWLNKDGNLVDVPKDRYYMDGYQGQRVFIIPSKELVVVRMGLSDIDFNKMLREIIAALNN